MASDQRPVEHLRSYLSGLSPEARAILVSRLEKGALGGQALPGADLILKALRPHLSEEEVRPQRGSNPVRLFFAPLAPFLMDAADIRERPCRMERESLGPLWEWIGRDLLPTAMTTYAEAVSAALLADDDKRALACADAFQGAVVEAITQSLGAGDDRSRRRVSAQIALAHSLRDLEFLYLVLRNRAALDRLARRLPPTISNLGEDQLDNLLTLLKQTAAEAPDCLWLTLVMVMGRLGPKWQLARLAVRAIDSDLAERVSRGPLAPAVELVFAEFRAGAEAMRAALRGGRMPEAIANCKTLHDGIRGLRTEINFSGDKRWGRDLATIRSEVSAMLAAEIEATPGLVRRLLRPRPAKEVSIIGRLDESDVAEAEGRIELTAACRHYASELAINEIAPRVFGELRTYFEMTTPALIEALRVARGMERNFRRAQTDTAVRLARKLFDEEYADLLARAVAMAESDGTATKAAG